MSVESQDKALPAEASACTGKCACGCDPQKEEGTGARSQATGCMNKNYEWDFSPYAMSLGINRLGEQSITRSSDSREEGTFNLRIGPCPECGVVMYDTVPVHECESKSLETWLRVASAYVDSQTGQHGDSQPSPWDEVGGLPSFKDCYSAVDQSPITGIKIPARARHIPVVPFVQFGRATEAPWSMDEETTEDAPLSYRLWYRYYRLKAKLKRLLGVGRDTNPWPQ